MFWAYTPRPLVVSPFDDSSSFEFPSLKMNWKIHLFISQSYKKPKHTKIYRFYAYLLCENASLEKIFEMVKMIKIEKILKGNLHLISSPSPMLKVQIMCWTICLRCKGKILLGIVNKLLKTKWLFTSPGNVLPQVNFHANNLNFHWRWWDQIQAIFLNLFYFFLSFWSHPPSPFADVI